MTFPRQGSIMGKISSEGYCCLYGYLALCTARGETVEDMAANIGMSKDTIWYHLRKLKDETVLNPPKCLKIKDCLDPVIQELYAEHALSQESAPHLPGISPPASRSS